MLREIENATTEPMQLNEFTVSHPRARNVVITICFPERTNEKAFILLKAVFLSKNKEGRKKIKLKGLGLCAPTVFTQSESHTCSEPCRAGRQPPQMLSFEPWVVN